MAFVANANDTSFTSEWADEADDAWANTDDSANAANVDVVRPYIKVINGDGITHFYRNTVASLVEIAAVIDTDELTDEQMANINSILALAK